MSEKSLYEMYLEQLTSQHLKEVSASAAHQQTIIDFGKAMAPFNVRPIICVHPHDDSLSLMIACVNDAESGVVMSQLMAAGYDVDEPEQLGMQLNGRDNYLDNYRAKVRGHGFKFKLMFDIPRTVAA